MKKHLIAAAVAGALAVPAMAQVSISGNVEAGYVSKDNSATVDQKTVSKFVGTPGITFKGSEDLGGGMKASFQLTQDIDTPTGLQSGFQIATVSLAGGFGEVRLGRNHPSTRDAGGVYRFFGDIGRLTSNLNEAAYVERGIQYTTPSVAGVKGVIFSADPDDGASVKRTAYGVMGSVAGAKFSVAQETQETVANVETKLMTVGASMDLGMAKVGLVYAKEDYETADDLKATGIHIAVPVGGMTVGGSFTQYEAGAGETDILALALQYSLSKRTSVFATYQTVDAGTTAAGSGASRGLSVGETAGEKNSGFGVSVVHNF
jgi:predicted porin